MQSSLKFFCRTGSLLLAAFTLLSCLGPIMFMLGPVALPCELMTHFRLQFTLVLIVMTGALFALKLRNYGIISLVALVMNAVPIILLYAPQNASANPEASAGARAQSGAEGEAGPAKESSPTTESSPTKESSPIKVRLISSNVNNRNKSYKEVLEVLSSKDADIICINELAPKMSEFLKENLKSYPYNCLGAREDCFGIGVFRRYPLVAPKVVTLSGSGVPTVVTDVDVNGKHFRLISTHPTPPVSVQWFNWRNQQFSELAKLSRGSDIPVVVAGDLNSTCWSPYFERLLQDGSLYDSAVADLYRV